MPSYSGRLPSESFKIETQLDRDAKAAQQSPIVSPAAGAAASGFEQGVAPIAPVTAPTALPVVDATATPITPSSITPSPVAAPVAPVAPFVPRDLSVSETTTTYKVPTVGYKKALAASESASDNLTEAQVGEVIEDTKFLQNEVLGAKKELNEADKKFQADYDRVSQAGDAALKVALDNYDKAIKEESGKSYEGFWARKGTAGTILGAISLALGAIGAMNGKGNAAADIISDAIDKDYQQYADETKKRLDLIEKSKLGALEKNNMVNQELTRLNARRVAAREQVNSLLDVAATQNASNKQVLKIDQLRAMNEKQKAEDRKAFESLLTSNVSTVTKKTQQDLSKIDDLTNDLAGRDSVKKYSGLVGTTEAVKSFFTPDGKLKDPKDADTVVQMSAKALNEGMVTDSDFAIFASEEGLDKGGLYNRIRELVAGRKPADPATAERLFKAVRNSTNARGQVVNELATEYYNRGEQRFGEGAGASVLSGAGIGSLVPSVKQRLANPNAAPVGAITGGAAPVAEVEAVVSTSQPDSAGRQAREYSDGTFDVVDKSGNLVQSRRPKKKE